jgi:hypothetical protein
MQLDSPNFTLPRGRLDLCHAIGLVMANIGRLGEGVSIEPQKFAGDAVFN